MENYEYFGRYLLNFYNFPDIAGSGVYFWKKG